jgi:hypothetical protein
MSNQSEQQKKPSEMTLDEFNDLLNCEPRQHQNQ